MRTDFQIALLCAVASIPAGLAMSEAVEYIPWLKAHAGFGFWSSLGVAFFLLAFAAKIAIRGEQAAEREGAKKRMIPLSGMIIFGFAFICCAAWYFWPTPSMEQTPVNKVAIGSLVFDSGQMEIRHKINTDQTAGRMLFVLRNGTDKLIAFKAVLYGDINGTAINPEHKYFTGFIYPNEKSKMVSDMVENIVVYDTSSPSQPSIVGRLRYEIQYKSADEDNFYRETAKTLIYSGFFQATEQARRTEEPTTVLFSDSLEK